MTLDSELQLLPDGARVGAAVDQAGRPRLSLLRQIADLDGPRDLDRELLQVGKGWPLTYLDCHLDHVGELENGGRDPFGYGFEEVCGLALEDLASGLLQPRIADGVMDAVAGSCPLGVEDHLEVGGEGLAQLPLRRIVAVIAEGGQPGKNQATGW